jgi:signal transduction histidine kinase
MRTTLTSLLAACILSTAAYADPDKHTDFSAMAVPDPGDSSVELAAMVRDASGLLRKKGESAFRDFQVAGSRWNRGERYVFVLEPNGNMVVHPELAGRNQMELTDINGKRIVRGLIDAATSNPAKTEGWYHYQWPVPGGLLPRWKSSFVQKVKAPSGKTYIVGSGIYNDRMEKEFVEDMVKDAVAAIEKNRDAAFAGFHDPRGPYMAKDAYVFVIDRKGIDLVNPGFRNLEGRNIMELKDSHGKYLTKEMLSVVQAGGSGWVDYMWPKPGESVPTRKSTYVSKAKVGDDWLLVGCGAYLADAPRSAVKVGKMSAPALSSLVRDAAVIFEQKGEEAFPEFRRKGTRWFNDSIYFFAWTMEGTRIFHAAEPETEGLDVKDLRDVNGRPIGQMMLGAGSSPSGEGWVHYMYPEPGNIFPEWKSSFVKRVTFPSGKTHIIGCGIYQMQMDRDFIRDVVDRASELVASRGTQAFDQLRDRNGAYRFMDTYVFVDDTTGVEWVNPAQPSLEGKNLIDLRDAKGKYVARECIDLAMKDGKGWVDYHWYRPGSNDIVQKHSYVRKVVHAGKTYIVGAGLYDPY